MKSGLRIKLDFRMMLLNRQRLLSVLKKEAGVFVKSSLKDTFSALVNSLSLKNFSSATFLVGKTLDLETLFSAKMWAKRWFKKAFFLQDFFVNSGVMHKFFFTKQLLILDNKKLYNSSYIILLATNVRYELPVVNLKIKKISKDKAIPIFVWGVPGAFNYPIYNMGTNLKNFLNIFCGKSKMSAYLQGKEGFCFASPHVMTADLLAFITKNFSLKNNLCIYFVTTFITLLNQLANNFVSLTNGITNFSSSIIFNVQADDHVMKFVKPKLYVYFGSYGY